MTVPSAAGDKFDAAGNRHRIAALKDDVKQDSGKLEEIREGEKG